MKLFVALFTAIPLIFLGVGAWQAHEQSTRLKRFLPVKAEVIETDVESHTSSSTSNGGSSTTYKPVVTYRYEVNGQSYTCREVTPIRFSSSDYDWAREVVARFEDARAGEQSVDAWYNPDDPSDAYLLKEATFFPYMFALFPMLFFAVVAFMATRMISSKADPLEPVPNQPGWTQIRPRSLATYKRLAAMLVALAWNGLGVLVARHYSSVVEGGWGVLATVTLGIYFGLGVIPVVMTVYYWMVGRAIDDPVITIEAETLRLGETITIQVEQFCKRAVAVQELTLGLRCRKDSKTRHGGKTSYSSSVVYEEGIPTISDYEASAGETLLASCQVPLPADGNPTRLDDYPKYIWTIDVHTALASYPDYRGRFPVNVHPPFNTV